MQIDEKCVKKKARMLNQNNKKSKNFAWLMWYKVMYIYWVEIKPTQAIGLNFVIGKVNVTKNETSELKILF